MAICENRVVIITGAGGGLGKAYAQVLAAEGAKVVVNDINLKAAEDVVSSIAPENVASIVVWLGSEASRNVTGCLFEAEGGKLSIADGWRQGPQKDKGARWEPSELGDIVNELMGEAIPAQKVYGS